MKQDEIAALARKHFGFGHGIDWSALQDFARDVRSLEADKIVHMTLACQNVDHGEAGWYALRIDKSNRCKETVGRGATAWEAVRKAFAA